MNEPSAISLSKAIPTKRMAPKKEYPKTPWGKVRKELKATQTRMANMLGVLQPYYWRMEHRSKPTSELEGALLKCFQANAKQVAEWLENPH